MSNKIKKDFYIEHQRVEERAWEDIDKFLNLHQIKFSGFDVPKPIFSLDEIKFPDYVMDELKMQGINRPTAIQSLAWPCLYSGRDLMCIGLPIHSRVISYICPALVHIKQQDPEVRKKGPLVLIATQTKEVAKEILTHSQMFIQQAHCQYCCLFDDENMNTQEIQLRGLEPDILIGNYHRLCELLDNGFINLKNVTFLIMDDFYRNRSARLSDEIKRVVIETRTDRQTAIYSRIVPSGLQKSNGDEFQNDAVFICVGNDDINVVHKDLPQTIHICTMAEKKKKLQDVLKEISEKDKNFKILVYANGFKKIRITEKIVKEIGIDTFAYERTNVGRRRRAMKERVYKNFNTTPNSVLIASDVVSNKVDLPDLNYIINADFPVNLSLYLNRMRQGIRKYISLFIAEDARHADRLIYVLNECRQEIPQILYKISEAYTNSGKDVDRMPSLTEISDGQTKPVEKPIPKPLPPTVPLSTNNINAAKRPLEEKMKQIQQLHVNGGSTNAASTNIMTNGISKQHHQQQQTTTQNYNNNKRVKRFHNNHNQPPQNSYYNLTSPPPQTPSVYSPYTNYYNSNVIHTTNANNPYYSQPYVNTTNQQIQINNIYPPYNNNVTLHSPPPLAQPPPQPSHQQLIQVDYIKSEPMEPTEGSYQYYNNNNDQQENQDQQSQQGGYFVNPIPFKQEPQDNSYDFAASSSTSSTTTTTATTQNIPSETIEPTNIVNHLLRDQQVLNLLEKVRATITTPTQSMYQNTWNFGR